MELLRIIAGSWPIAAMFTSACATGVVLYIVNWFKRSDLEDKAIRASTAVTVRPTAREYE